MRKSIHLREPAGIVDRYLCRVNAFNGTLRQELVSTPIRVTQILPGMVETGGYCRNSNMLTAYLFALKNSQLCVSVATKPPLIRFIPVCSLVREIVPIIACFISSRCPVTGEDVAEDIVWAASRPPHVNVAEVLLLPVNQATAKINYRTPAQ